MLAHDDLLTSSLPTVNRVSISAPELAYSDRNAPDRTNDSDMPWEKGTHDSLREKILKYGYEIFLIPHKITWV